MKEKDTISAKARTAALLLLCGSAMLSATFLLPHTGLLALFALVPLFIAERMLTQYGIRHSWWYHYGFFLVFNILTTFWIWNISPAGAVAAIALNALQMSVIFSIFRWSRRRLGGILPYLLLTFLWMAWERVYCNVEISWPWLQLGNAFAGSTGLVQWYEITGVLGGSLWIFASNLLFYALFEYVRTRRDAPLFKRHTGALTIGWATVLLIPLAFSIVRFKTYRETDDPREVVVIQPNIDPVNGKYGGVEQGRLDDDLLRQAGELTTDLTSLVVTPETFTYDIDLDRPMENLSFSKYYGFTKRHPHAGFLAGALAYRIFRQAEKPSEAAKAGNGFWYETYNTALMLDASGNTGTSYKSKLVPGVEIIPYEKYVPWLGKLVGRFGGSTSSYAREKDGMSVLETADGTKLCVPICYESVYSDYCRQAVSRGAQLIAVITNDGWWGDTPGHIQHFNYAKLRAIETRRDVIHCANNGTSALIDQKGGCTFKTDYWTKVAFVGNVNVNDTMTFFVQHGDIIGRLSCFISLLLLLACLVLPLSSRGR